MKTSWGNELLYPSVQYDCRCARKAVQGGSLSSGSLEALGTRLQPVEQTSLSGLPGRLEPLVPFWGIISVLGLLWSWSDDAKEPRARRRRLGLGLGVPGPLDSGPQPSGKPTLRSTDVDDLWVLPGVDHLLRKGRLFHTACLSHAMTFLKSLSWRQVASTCLKRLPFVRFDLYANDASAWNERNNAKD